jgi:hypothetical protein
VAAAAVLLCAVVLVGGAAAAVDGADDGAVAASDKVTTASDSAGAVPLLQVISGRVHKVKKDRGVSGVDVWLNGGQLHAITDKEGAFAFPPLPHGAQLPAVCLAVQVLGRSLAALLPLRRRRVCTGGYFAPLCFQLGTCLHRCAPGCMQRQWRGSCRHRRRLSPPSSAVLSLAGRQYVVTLSETGVVAREVPFPGAEKHKTAFPLTVLVQTVPLYFEVGDVEARRSLLWCGVGVCTSLKEGSACVTRGRAGAMSLH